MTASMHLRFIYRPGAEWGPVAFSLTINNAGFQTMQE